MPGKLFGDKCKSNKCTPEYYYPNITGLAIPDPSNADFTSVQVGDLEVACLPCPPATAIAGSACPQNRTTCVFRVTYDMNAGVRMCVYLVCWAACLLLLFRLQGSIAVEGASGSEGGGYDKEGWLHFLAQTLTEY